MVLCLLVLLFVLIVLLLSFVVILKRAWYLLVSLLLFIYCIVIDSIALCLSLMVSLGCFVRGCLCVFDFVCFCCDLVLSIILYLIC